MNPRISLGGYRLRVRISNAYGNRPLTMGRRRSPTRAGYRRGQRPQAQLQR
jgi:hypothetical protein